MAKQALKAYHRSGTVACDLCKCLGRPLQEHHINGRDVHDADRLYNKCYICCQCHEDVHLGLVEIEGYFNSTAGKVLLWHKKNADPVTDRRSFPHLIT